MKHKFKTLKDHKEEIRIQKLCWDNNIRAYVKPTRQGKNPPVTIVLEYRGQLIEGKKVYKQNSPELSEMLTEVYLWAYNRLGSL